MPSRFHMTALALSISAFSAPALAVPEDDGGRIVVTATRQAQRTNELLADVTVVTRHDIEESPATSLTELLGGLAGIGVAQTGGMGANTSLFVRGTNTNHVVVLIDGQRVSSATTGATSIEHLPLEQIERIEVLRGPASSLYGADALGGVIQIFTRSGAAAPGLQIFAETGRYATHRANASVGGQHGDTTYLMSVGREVNGGVSSVRGPTTSFTNIYNPDDDAYRNTNLSFRASQRLGNGNTAGLSGLWVDTATHFDATNCDAAFTLCTPNFDNRQTQQLGSISAYLGSELASFWKSTIRVGHSVDKTASWRLDPVASQEAVDRYRTTQKQASWQNDLTTRLGRVMLALDWRDEQVNSTQNFVVSSRRTTAAVAGYTGNFGSHDLQLNARVDSIERMGRHRSGSLGYGYRFSDAWRARAAIGRAFHAPTFNDLYWPMDPVNFYQGNPNLRPERGMNRELAVNFEHGGLVAGLTVYRNQVSDLLNFVNGSAPTFIGQYDNVDQALLKGATLHAEWTAHGWTLKGQHDVLSARDAATGLFLQRRMPRATMLALRHAVGAWDYGAQIQRFASRFNNTSNTQTLGGYTLVHLEARYRVNAEWSVQARVNNLFDEDYVVVRESFSLNDYSVPGRSLFIAVRYTPR